MDLDFLKASDHDLDESKDEHSAFNDVLLTDIIGAICLILMLF